MKCKVTNSVSHAQTNKNEASVLRRSSRRATIERRVWAVLKKPSKPGPSAKGKCPPKAEKKGGKKSQAKGQTKTLSRGRPPQSLKRSLSTTEEAGTARRKVKKKESTKDTGTDSGSASEVPSEPVSKKRKKASGVCEKEPGESEEVKVNSQKRWGESTPEDQGMGLSEPKDTVTDDRTQWCGDPSSDSARGSNLDTLCYAVETYGGRNVEEALLTDEVCLHKVIVEEVVTDYRISKSKCENEALSVEADIKEDTAYKEEHKELEEGPRLPQSHDEKCSEESSEEIKVNKAEKSESETQLSDSSVSDDTTGGSVCSKEQESGVKKAPIRDRSSEGKNSAVAKDSKSDPRKSKSVEDGLKGKKRRSVTKEKGSNDKNLVLVEDETSDNKKSSLSEVNAANAVKQEEVHSLKGLSVEQSVETDKECDGSDSKKPDIQDDQDEKSENNALVNEDEQKESVEDELKLENQTPIEEDVVVPTVTQSTPAEEYEEDHVSLALALAQLVNSESGGEVEGAETVTIHSAPSVDHLQDPAGVVTLECQGKERNKPESPCPAEDEEYLEDEEGELIIKEEDEEEELADESEEEEEFTTGFKKCSQNEVEKTTTSEDVLEREVDQVRHLEEPEGDPEETETRSRSETPPPQLLPQKSKKQLPPLIKISSRPPAIKTPLKCPECPMQFCTVRSLLWHFGTHGARSRDSCIPPILLQDLIVPWDKPSVSLFISQPAEMERNSERTINANENTGTTPLSSSADNTIKIDIVSKPDIPSAIQLVRTEDYMGSNGDVILKVPIPRLKPKSHSNQFHKKDKFVNILPKLTTGDGAVASQPTQASPQPALIQPSGSPTPQITVHPQPAVQSAGSGTVDQASSTQPQMPKITIRASNKLQIQPLGSSQSPPVQVQPPSLQVQSPPVQPQSTVQLQQSTVQVQSQQQTPSALQVQTATGVQVQPMVTTSKNSSSAPSHITLIPMDKLTAVGQSISPRGSKLNTGPLRMVTPPAMPVKTSNTGDGVMEKDGLVMINSNLALRIVSSLPSSLDSVTNTTNSTTLRPIASQTTNNLTIVPQTESNKMNSKLETAKSPDILTIVPQIDLSKKVSLLKSPNTVSSNQVVSTSPKQPPTPQSQVVKLYLLQPKDQKTSSGSLKFNLAADTTKVNGIEVPLPLPNGSEKFNAQDTEVKGNTSESSEGEEGEEEDVEEEEEEEEDDDDDEGMVIDDGKEGEDDVMDPLSLCAVTMEEENLEALNSANQNAQSGANRAAASVDKAVTSIITLPVRPKGKNGQAVDIVKYEARKYVCCYCNRRFGWSTDLKRHVILHTGEKPFQCKVCPTAFTRKFLLQNHMKRMHPDKCKMSDLWP